MDVRDGLAGAIGRTPLIKLRRISEATGCTVLGKAEFLNPGGSVKDRAALFILLDAERRGLIEPGSTVVEGTAGNTGVGLALMGNARGYHTVIVMPQSQSQEKKDLLRVCGAEVVEVPAVPYRDQNNYIRVSERLARELAEREPKGVLWANQWDNLANRRAHFETTGPEIWEQTDGRVDAFISAIGTGGTLSGVGLFLKEKRKEIAIALADPMGAAMYNWFKHGELRSEGDSVTEGIGQGRITANVDGTPVDEAYQIPDEEALPILFDLVNDEGLFLGGSSGINVAGAVRLAGQLGPGHTIDGPRRFRRALLLEALESRVLAQQGTAGPSVARGETLARQRYGLTVVSPFFQKEPADAQEEPRAAMRSGSEAMWNVPRRVANMIIAEQIDAQTVHAVLHALRLVFDSMRATEQMDAEFELKEVAAEMAEIENPDVIVAVDFEHR
jgi:cysteine synthase